MSRMFPEEVDGEPRLEILEHPKSRGFRFRYTCEGPSHGGIPGASSDKNKKTFPAVKIVNYQGYARIVVQLVTNEENPRLHPHSLVGKQCQNGICTVQCGPKDMTATFPNLGIQHVTKKNVASILEERYIAAEMQLSSINDGFPQEVQRNIKDEDRKRIAAKAQSEAKSIDLSVVRLMFIAYLPDSQGAFTIMLKPIISDAIFDSKAPNAATLKICRMDCNAGSASGGDEVYLLCDKVQKGTGKMRSYLDFLQKNPIFKLYNVVDDIQVRFVEEDPHGREVWENYGSFCPTDVHRQFAIVFRTPPYKDQFINQAVNVNVQLRRKSDGEVSEPRAFTYLPNKTDFDLIERKRRKMIPDYLDHIGGNNSQGFNFSGSAAGGNSVQGNFQFEGSSGSSNEKKATIAPFLLMSKKTNPQKGPVAPHILMKKFQPFKPETASTVEIKQEDISQTRIPKPKGLQAQKYSGSNNVSSATPASTNRNQCVATPRITSTNVRCFASEMQADRALAMPCPRNGFMSTISTRTVAMNNIKTDFTDQFFATPPHQSIHYQMSLPTGACVSTTSSSPLPFSRYMLDEASSQAFPSTANCFTLTDDDILRFLENDIETDGAMGNRREECDFASVLYDGDATISVDAQMSSTGKERHSDTVQSDCADFIDEMKSLSLIGSLASRDNDLLRNNSESNQKPTAHVENSQRSKTNIESDENFNSTYKMAEAKKMAIAMLKFSVTGDVRQLLHLQRHLTAARDENGDTVLHLAVIHDQLDVLSSVLDVVASLENRDEILNSVNSDQQTALQIAVLTDNVEAVIELLKIGANPLISDGNGNHSIHVASRHGNADILSRLLNSSFAQIQQFDTKNYKGFGCYHLAVKAKQDNEECLLLLRDRFCDVDSQDEKSGRTALHLAVEMQKIDVVRCLVSQCDADVDKSTHEGYTPLHLASATGCCEIATVLLLHRANVTAVSFDEEKTAVDLAPSEKMRDILTGKISSANFENTTANSNKQEILFDRSLRNRFFALLNAEVTGSNWNELADRLQLSMSKRSLQLSDNPTASLIETYWMSHGTVNGLRSALMNIGRFDAVQILNRAVHCKLNQTCQNNQLQAC